MGGRGTGRRGRPPLSQNISSSRSGSRRATPTLLDYTDIASTQFREGSDIEFDDGESWKSAIEEFQKTVERSLKDLNKSISKLEKDLGRAVEYQSKRIDDLEIKVEEKDRECETLREKIRVLENFQDTSAEEINKLERFSRRNNFRIVGIPVTDQEDCESVVKEKVFSLFTDAPDLAIERCHRDGRGFNGKPPHILVRCLSYKAKTFIMRNRRVALQGQTFFIVDDLTKVDLLQKKKWSQKVKDLYDSGTKLFFSAGKWRDGSGRPFEF